MGALILMFLPQAWKMPTRNTAPIPPCMPRGTITFILRQMGIDERFSHRLTSPLQPRAGAAEMGLPPPSLVFLFVAISSPPLSYG
jgi:hypothetical protein